MMVDLDFFKRVNDTYGHMAGDEALKQTAMRMKEGMRSYDLFARYGGEEFVVFLSDIDEEFVIEFAERIRKDIEEASRKKDWKSVPITLSIGLALNDQADSLEELLFNADKALYAAKRNGRNQTALYRGDYPVFFGEPLVESLVGSGENDHKI
jgi:diguanylate cyclase (GGDEF)-like protein